MLRRLVLISAVFGLFSPVALAWGSHGHRAVCEIAWQRMDDATRDAIRELLRADPGESRFSRACTWADRIRGDDRYERDEPRHYVNVRPGFDAPDRERDCPGTCVLEGIEHYRLGLTSRAPDSERVVALKFLAHFVGDLHQPLHVGYAEDRGGNRIRVRVRGRDRNPRGRAYDLHGVWDTEVFDSRESPDDLARRLLAGLTTEQAAAWRGGRPIDWAAESFDLARSVAYRVHAGENLDAGTLDWYRDVAERRVLQAGVRLAVLLDGALGPSGRR